MLLRYLFVILCLLSTQVMAQQPLPVPTLESHKAFLVGEWKANAPSVVAFKDPFCPYCLKALEKKDELDNVNLFLFWYPIFGEKSDNRVAEFFKCESPVSNQVIQAVLQRKGPECKLEANAELIALNKQMYEAYNPSGVPAFYLGGQKVSFAEIKSIRLGETESVGVSLDWERYGFNRLATQSSSPKKAAIYLAEDTSARDLKKLATLLQTQQDYQWFIFPTNARQLNKSVCNLFEHKCNDGKKENILSTSAEVELLYGFDRAGKNQLIINGRAVAAQHLPNSLEKFSQFIQ